MFDTIFFSAFLKYFKSMHKGLLIEKFSKCKEKLSKMILSLKLDMQLK